MTSNASVPRDPSDRLALLDAIQHRTVASLPRAQLVRRLSSVASWSGAAMVLIGALTVAGWVADVPELTRIGSATATMKLSAAVCVIALGVAILAKASVDRRVRLLAVALATVVGVVAAVQLSESAVQASYGVDNWFGLDSAAAADLPGRMAPPTAGGLVLLAAALVCGHRRRYWLSQLLAFGCGATSAMFLLGHAYGADSLGSVGPFSTMSVNSSAALALGAVGVVLRHADQGFASLLSGNTAGGIIVRRFLPFALLVPPAAGWLVVRFEQVNPGLSSAGLMAVTASGVGLLGAVLVWVQSSRLRTVDLRRAGAENAFTIAREALRDQEAAEQRTRAILAASAAGYLSFDRGGTVTDVNAAASVILGLGRDQVVGRRIDQMVFRSHQVDGARSALRTYLDGDGPAPTDQRYEATTVSHDGRHLTLEVVLWTVVAEGVASFHVLLTDITQRTEAERELKRANDDLTNFSAAMAHDLRTPLTVVKGFAGLLGSRVDDPELLGWVRRVLGAADRGSRLIDDILAFAQVGRDEVRSEVVDLEELARDLAEDLAATHPRPHQLKVLAIPPVLGDPRLLSQLLSNLLGNSLKYVAADREVEILVDAVHDPDEAWPVLRVSDNGDQIADPSGIFEMFNRGAPHDQVVGSGVGLAVCRRIAELHGGRIWLEEAPSGGPRFCVLLPAVPGLAAR